MLLKKSFPNILCAGITLGLAACANQSSKEAISPTAQPAKVPELYGTLEPAASDAVYFVLTDRFVNGDETNDFRSQAAADGKWPTFDVPTPGGPAGESDNVGYLGGDFKGLLQHANYIKEMGFGAVWITPIVDNPDEGFSGGKPAAWKGFYTDGGKSGFHGYWGVNFFKLDEHLPSPDLDFKGLTTGLKQQGLKTVLDIVANHGSPSFSMPKDQPKYGEIYDETGKLIADHQNLTSDKIDPKNNPLHSFYAKRTELAELSDNDENNPVVLDYFTRAYLQWIDQGADAFRIDTIRQMSPEFWRKFSANIRAKHPGFFMFAEAYDYDPNKIAVFTQPEGGSVSVLDFPLKKAIETAFSTPAGGYTDLDAALSLTNSPFANAYELMSFYDNHDMARFAGSDSDFINAHNFLFTARGIPVIYYGSEMGFMRGTAEHAGNRNFYGEANIAKAKQHPIYAPMVNAAQLRANNIALQRGLQFNLSVTKDQMSFLRVFQHQGQAQTALVLLNKSALAASMRLDPRLSTGTWTDAQSKASIESRDAVSVPAHGLRVLIRDYPIDGEIAATLSALQAKPAK
jgi:glycosidase